MLKSVRNSLNETSLSNKGPINYSLEVQRGSSDDKTLKDSCVYHSREDIRADQKVLPIITDHTELHCFCGFLFAIVDMLVLMR